MSTLTQTQTITQEAASSSSSSSFIPRNILSVAPAPTANRGVLIRNVVDQDGDHIPHDPVLLLDHVHMPVQDDKPVGAGDHPHRGFEIITYSLPDSTVNFMHEDS